MNIKIQNIDNNLIVDSRIIAKGFEIEHHSLCKSLSEHFTDLKSVKSSESGKGRPVRYFHLLKRHIMILPSIVKPNERTVKFQTALVDAYLAMEMELQSQITNDPFKQLQSPEGIRQLLEIAQEKYKLEGEVKQLETKVEELAPKAEYHDTVCDTKDWKALWDFGKVSKIGPKKIFDVCLKLKLLYKSNEKLVPKQQYIECGWFKLVEYTYVDAHGEGRRGYKVYVSGRGQSIILKKWNQQNQLELN